MAHTRSTSASQTPLQHATEIRNAILKNDEKSALEKLTKEDASILFENDNSLILDATEKGFHRLVQQLINNGADPYHQNKHGWNALILSIQCEQHAVTNVIMNSNAKISNYNIEAVLFAVAKDNKSLTEKLLENAGEAIAPLLNSWTHENQIALYTATKNAAQTGDYTIVNLLMDYNANPHHRTLNNSNVSPFELACKEKTETAALTIASHAKFIPLHNIGELVYHCVEKGWLKLAALLLKQEKKLKRPDSLNTYTLEGYTSLMLAIKKGNIDAITLLLSYGANPFKTYSHNNNVKSALSVAISDKSDKKESMIKLLLESPAEITEEIGCGVIQGVECNEWPVVRDLLNFTKEKLGEEATKRILASWHSKNRSALYLAAEKNNGAGRFLTILLLAFGADPHQKRENLETPFQLACGFKTRDIAYAMVTSKNFILPANLGEIIIKCIEKDWLSIAEILLTAEKTKKDKNFGLDFTKDGKSALHLVVEKLASEKDVKQALTLIQLFMDCHANPHLNAGKKTPFQICLSKNVTLALNMAEHPNFTLPDNLGEIVLTCLEKGWKSLAKILLTKAKETGRKDFDFDQAVTKEKNTSLHLAAKADDMEIVQLLLDCGADPEKWNEKNQTPHSILIVKGHKEITDSILERPGEVTNNIGAAIIYAMNKGDMKQTKQLCEKAGKAITKSVFEKTTLRKKNSVLSYFLEKGNADFIHFIMDNAIDRNPDQLTNERIQLLGAEYIRQYGENPSFLHKSQPVARKLQDYNKSTPVSEKWRFLAECYSELPEPDGWLAINIRTLFETSFGLKDKLIVKGMTVKQVSDRLMLLMDGHYKNLNNPLQKNTNMIVPPHYPSYEDVRPPADYLIPTQIEAYPPDANPYEPQPPPPPYYNFFHTIYRNDGAQMMFFQPAPAVVPPSYTLNAELEQNKRNSKS